MNALRLPFVPLSRDQLGIRTRWHIVGLCVGVRGSVVAPIVRAFSTALLFHMVSEA